jgi:hypothetical protein
VYRSTRSWHYIFTLDPDPIGGIVGTSARRPWYQGFRDDPARPAGRRRSHGSRGFVRGRAGRRLVRDPQASGIEFVHAGIGGTVRAADRVIDPEWLDRGDGG